MNWKAINFDWNRARAFLVTAEEGSLSAAARALGTTQPTVGRQITALEAELGITLFERLAHGLVLTQGGLELLDHVRQMGDAANALSLSAKGRSEQLEGTVCLSVSEGDAFYQVPDIVDMLRRTEPGIKIEIVVSNEVSDLKRREADIALRCFRPTQGDLIAKKLYDERLWFYASSEFCAQHRARISAVTRYSDIKQLPLIGYDQSPRFFDYLEGIGGLSEADVTAYTRCHPLQIRLAQRGLGMMITTEFIEQQEPNLQKVFPHLEPIFEMPVWLVCHRELHTNQCVRRVFDAIVSAIKVD